MVSTHQSALIEAVAAQLANADQIQPPEVYWERRREPTKERYRKLARTAYATIMDDLANNPVQKISDE